MNPFNNNLGGFVTTIEKCKNAQDEWPFQCFMICLRVVSKNLKSTFQLKLNLSMNWIF